MPSFLTPLHEHNDCHNPAGSGAGGEFCGDGAATQKRKRPGRSRGGADYEIMFRSAVARTYGWLPFLHAGPREILTSEDLRKARSARVVLRFKAYASAHLGAPIKWRAPNGVEVAYFRGQRRSEREGSVGVYHDFNVTGDEFVIPLTRNVGSGRRALRAWARTFTADKTTLRFQARQLVRPGD